MFVPVPFRGSSTPGTETPLGLRPNNDCTMEDVDAPVTKAETLVTDDGVPIDTVHLAQDSDLAIVLAHGFTLSWQRPAVWQIATPLQRMGGGGAVALRGAGPARGVCDN